jgi:hypothetical protein
MVDPISLMLLTKLGAAILTKVGATHAATTGAATLLGGATALGATSILIVATCYAIEKFVNNATAKAIAAGVRKFAVWVLKKSWSVVEFVAQTLSGQYLTSSTTSWDSLSGGVQEALNNNNGSFQNQYST